MDRDFCSDPIWGLVVWWNCYADQPSFLLGLFAGTLICLLIALVFHASNPAR
jgi:hypothetical protein